MKTYLINVIVDMFAVIYSLTDKFRALISRLLSLSYARSRIKQGSIPLTTQFDGKIVIVKGSSLNVGEHCRLGSNVFFETDSAGKIRLGNNVRINSGSFLVSHVDISIGNDCLIGEYVSIRDSNHGLEKGSLMRSQPHNGEKITIAENVWIGRGAAILKGVNIGKGAIVAANSVVTHDVESYVVVAGTPAKEIKKIK